MLFDALAASEPGVYFVQIAWTLRGALDAPAFLRAWQEVTDRHGILRTGFAWERLERPVQIVRRRATLPVHEEDLRGMPAAAQEARLAQFAADDRCRGFDLTKAPLMRVALFRIGEDAYRFVWSRHHLLLDGWSTPLVVKEVFAIYDARRRGTTPLVEPSRPFGDYIGWLVREDPRKLEAFWRARLAGFGAKVALSVDHPARGERRHAEKKIALPDELSARLSTFVKQRQITMSTLVQAAWSILLARYGGESDVVFGATVSGRSAPVPGIDRMIGMFINTVPIRVDVTPDEPACAFLSRLHRQHIDLREHEHASLADVQAWSSVPRGTPLFETVVVFENYPIEDALRRGEGGLTIEGTRTIEGSTVPLMLVAQLRRALSLQISYDASRFDDDVVARMLAHLATLIEGLATEPEARLADVPMLPAVERAQVTQAWSHEAAPYARGRAAHVLFEEHAARAPHAIALVFGSEETTFAALDRRANQLAHRLRRLGIGPGARVGIALPRSPAMIVAVLGVLKAGGAYVPLDPSYPRDRLAFMIDDAGLAALVTDDAVAGMLPPHRVPAVRMDADGPSLAAEREDRLDVAVDVEDAAYVIYTSGSTGRPKGVVVPHRGLANVVEVHRRVLGAGPDLRVLQFSSLSFDASVWEICMSLLNGGTLVLAPPESLVGPELIALLERHEIGAALLPPSLLAALPDAKLPHLKCLISGGEACTADVAARWAPGRRMWNAYGPTEITIFATLGEIHADGGRPRLGPPIENARVYVLDERLAPVPIGVPGEIHIGGVGLALGYLGRPELTAERFVADPFMPGERMYRTGDRGRWLADGTLEYLGRLDHQIKLRGFRIELGEIEAALVAHPAVRRAAVLAREDTPGDTRLVAYLVASPEHALPSGTALRSFLEASLPAFMVPSIFVGLDRMPETPNGKLDRRALPAPEMPTAAETFVAPRGPVEAEIARIFAEVLRIPPESVGAHDGFFALGGHSLHATQAVARLRAALGIELPLRDLFEASTPAELAARAPGAASAGASPIVRGPRGGPLVPSFGQERLWFLQQLDPGDMSYVIPVTLRFSGALDAGALERALVEIVRRHEVLRTTYAAVGDGPMVFVHDDVEVPLPRVDLGALPDGARDRALREAIAEGMRTPFDLARGPLLRARLFALGPEEHVLYLTTHHIASDGWTQGLLHAELTALYEAFAAGRPSPLPSLSVQYADFAAWQRAFLTGEVYERQMGYWRDRLAGAPALDLPTDRPRPPVQSTRGALATTVLSPALTHGLVELSRREGATLFMTLLAAFDVLLQRYTGQDDIVVGTPIAGRNRPEIEPVFGFFVNALVLRTQLDEAMSFRDLVARVREVCLGAYAHQDVPFERIVQELAPERDRSRTPIFQVLVSMQNAPRAPRAPAGLTAASVRAESPTSKYDLTLMLSETARGLVIMAEYAVDLFDAATIERMLAHYLAVLAAAVRAPSAPIGEMRILSPEEELQLLVTWNDTAADYPRDRTVADLFAAQAARTPDAVAVAAGDERITYAALDARANQVAHCLRGFGIGPDVLVGLCLDRTIALVVGILGILKAGGAYVAIDPTLPLDRIAWMLEDASVAVVVTEDRIADELPGAAVMLRLDADAPLIDACSTEVPEPLATPESLAYVLYTSGSTGKPKGVLVHHRGLVNYLWWALSYYDAASGSGSPVHSSIGFDLTVTSLFTPLLAGRTAVLLPAPSEVDALARLLASSGGFSLVKLTPAHLEILSRLVPAQAVASATRAFVIGGEALSWETLAFFRAHAPGARLINEYGPTETVVGCSVYDGACAGDFTGGVPIGRPIANTRLYVLDRAMRPVPIGVRGELYIGGDGVARGYLGRPELTAARFVPDIFGEDPDGKLYRTGDLARWLPSGDLEFLGRLDHQVKIRGHRVELGEIEVTLAAHPGVRDTVVLLREDNPGDKRLVAYVVAEDDPAPDPAAFRAFLAQRLPEYMVPSAYVRLDALPLNENGKVDRRALPAPGSASIEGAYVAPRNAVEEMIAGIWADVLGLPRAGVTDGFFDLGGHSLLATQIIARIAAAFAVELPLQTIFETPTVAGLAERVGAALASGAAAPPIEPVPRDGTLPLSFAQERLWFLHQLDPASPFYNVPSALRLTGKLDVAALARALSEIARRHEVLRTTFRSEGGQPVQVIHPDAPLDFVVVRWPDMAPEDREEAARRETIEEAQRPFDLATGPVFRLRLVEMGDEDHLLLLSMHHIVSDGFTRGIVNRELSALYRAHVTGETPALPALPVQVADYAAWQRRWLSGEVLERHLAHWRRQLDGAPQVIELPLDRPRPPVQTYRGGRVIAGLPKAVAEALAATARREGATLFMVLLAALDVLLHRWTGQDDVVVGTSVTTRTRAEIDPLVGFFINALVLRTEVPDDLPFTELLRRARAVCLGAYAHQDLPFERLVQEMQPAPDPSRAPLFQVIFTMQNVPGEALDLPGITSRGVRADSAAVKYDLTFLMGPAKDGGLGITLDYNVDLFDASTVERMIGHLANLLRGIAEDPSRTVASLPMLSDGERDRLVAFRETGPAPASDACIHALFEAQVDRTPDAVAVASGHEVLTFDALDRRSNQLARRLRALGVGPDVVVAFCLGRSIETIVAILGILKAGGAYLPLDPTHPAPRLAELIEAAGARAIVTIVRFAGVLPAHVAKVTIDGDALAAESGTRIASGATPASLVYVLFTSGSTGKPKGVAVEHRNLVTYVRSVAAALDLPAGARYAHVSTFAADLGNTVLFPPLCLGGTLHVIPEALTTDPARLGAYFEEHAIDCLKIVPSHLAALLAGPRPERVLPRKRLVLGGEASTWELVDRVMQLSPGTRVLNHYGPTETTVGVVVHAVTAERPATPIVPLGRPLAGARIYVVDAALRPVPIGVPGEVLIGGAGVARGYLGRPDLTAERFLRDPFSDDPEARVYRTGDRARLLADGSLLFLGRTDFQIKIRGFRVEPGEIEAAVRAVVPGHEVTVIVRGTGAEAQLAAFIAGEGIDTAAVRSALAARLPEHMIPLSITALPALPLTPNGKIDRRALAERIASRDDSEDHVAPEGHVEEMLAAIWCDVFGRDRIGVHERFGDLGGHSLLAIQIIARVCEAFRVDIALRALFESPTIAGFSQHVERALREGRGLTVPALSRAPRDGALPLSFAQERFWFLHQLDPANPSYNVPSALRLVGRLDRVALERALEALVERHEILRTTFAAPDGTPVQIIHGEGSIALPVVHLDGVDAADRERAARAEAALEARRPFDLSAGPALRARLLVVAEDDHVLLFTLHHIVSDAVTRALLNRELSAFYRAFHEGETPSLPAPSMQYADFAVWQRGWLSGDALERQIAYWKAQLDGAPHVLSLPADRPRPPSMSHRGGVRVHVLPHAVRDAVKELARREGVTLFTALLAAYYVLLHRLAAADDLVVGTVIAGRGHARTEAIAGPLVNVLALRVRIDAETPFRALLARVHETCLDAYAHHDMPFERLVQALDIPRDPSRQPLVQVTFALNDVTREAMRLRGLETRGIGGVATTAKYDLSLSVTDAPHGLVVAAEHATDLFDAATVDRFLRCFGTLLEGITRDPEARAGELPLLTEGERRLLVIGCNDTATPWPEGLAAHELFEAQAARAPDAIAVVAGDRRISYAELDARANQLAHHLIEHGVGPESLVGVSLPRSVELVIAILGVMKAGGAYVPLDPAYPVDRLAFMMADARVAVVVTDEVSSARIPHPCARLVLLDGEDLAERSTASPGRRVAPENAAYVIYTSGSTGRPKGVVVEHRGLGNLAAAQAEGFRVTPESRVLQFASPSFDASVSEILVTLLAGATLVTAPQDALLPGPDLIRTLTDEAISVVTLPPSALAVLPDVALPALRTLVVAGEACSEEIAARWAPGRTFVNAYGPTETTVCATMAEHVPGTGRPPIGRPIANMRVHLLDARGVPVPVGVPGEIYIGGVGLARGYLHQPALTAERFVPSPLPEEPGARLYRTGDLGRRRADGQIEFKGRVDHQIKIRGHRVELGEIEAVLGEQPEIRDAVVVTRSDRPDEPRIVAYVVFEGAPMAVADLKQRLRARLPEPMVPAAIVALSALPSSPSGKVDRQALPAPDLAAAGGDREAHAARGPLDEAIADIFADVLRLDRVGIDEGFFDLGGHSLLGTQVVARIRAAFGVEPPLRDLFEAPTPAALAARVHDLLQRGQGMVAPRMARVARGPHLPLSFGQERLWFLAQLDPTDASYNIPLALRMEGALDRDALARALADLVRRHEVLRTTFQVEGGRPVPVVRDDLGLDLSLVSLAALPAAEREEARRRAIAAEAARPFDLAVGPLMRAVLLAIAPDDHVLLLTMHHIVSDGWSAGVINRELAALYEAHRTGEPAALPELAVQYADYAAWQRGFLAGGVLDRQLAYWKGALAGAPASLELPIDRPRPPVQTAAGARRTATLPPALAAAIKGLARREGATLFMTLLAAFDVLLHRRTGQDDVVVGTPIAGRTHAETEGLVGFFVNTLALRTQLDDALTFRALVARVKAACLGAYAHQDMPFERLVQEIAPNRDLARSPLFQVTFALQNAPRSALQLGGLSLRDAGEGAVSAKSDLTLVMTETASGLVASMVYNRDLFDGTSIDRMLAELRIVLEGAVEQPDVPIGALPILSESDRARCLDMGRGKHTAYPRGATIQALFATEAARRPDAIAVTFGVASITYGALDRRANQLAHHLRAAGVGVETPVGLYARRSLEMLVAILGILKAGGAYVPLDPDLPASRLAWLVADAGASIVVAAGAALDEGLLTDATVIRLDVDADRIAGESEAAPTAVGSAESLAYLMYTSGSTGAPKGVGVPHRAVVRLVKDTDYARFDESRVFLQLAPLAFDAATFELWGPLLNGGRLVVFPAEQPSLARIGEVIRDRHVTTLWLTAGLFNAMIDAHPEALAPLDQLLVGGEALSVPHVEKALALLPGVTLINGYGPTEGTTFSCCHVITSAEGVAGISIGRPIANTDAFILDARREPVPIGVPGELHIGGDGLARGYLGRPELTAERFVDTPHGRLYRTGDRARWLADGTIAFLGRLDLQVKLRGYRIEPGEIEATLAQHPGVAVAAVIVREDDPGDRRLVAYIVARGPSLPDADLAAWLSQRLPAYMVPSAFVMLEAMPLTPNGKLDRRALPAPEINLEGGAYVAPRGPVEEALASILAELLRVPSVGARDGFFALGGHSLLATQAVSRIRAAFGVDLPLRVLFEASTPEGLARRVEHALRGGRGLDRPAIQRVARGGRHPLSFAQERLWFLAQLAPDDPSYVVPITLRLGGTPSVPVLEQALAEIVRRHEVLRTTFALDGAEPYAVIREDITIPVAVTRFDATSMVRDAASTVAHFEAARGEGTDEAVRRAIAAESRRPFDLATGPLLRARLFERGSGGALLLLTMHHIVCDAWTIGVLRRELGALYEAFAAGRPSPLPELPIQYVDYAAWQRGFLSGDVLAGEIGYWRERLAGAPAVLDLPTDRPRPAIATHAGAQRSFSLRPDLAIALHDLARREGATIFMTLLAAFEVLLLRLTGQRDLVVGTPIAGRALAETESLAGLFLNLLVLRTEIDESLSFRALLARVKETCLGAYAHRDMPFEGLVQELAPLRDLGRSPLFQVLFTLQSEPRAPGAHAEPKRALDPIGPLDAETAKYDLSLSLHDGPVTLRGTFEYATDLFEQATIDRWIAELSTLLESIVAAPDGAVGHLDILPAEERRLLVSAWNDTRAPYAADACVHQLVAAQAERTPEAIAVSLEGRDELSYRDLDRRARRLARHLRARGVVPGARVGVALSRSSSMVVGLLGILAAGAAYVPLDPTYPCERLAFMAADAGIALLVTESALAGIVPAPAGGSVLLDADEPAIAAESDAPFDAGISSDAIAYVIYTSGSTGKPKGVPIPHRALINFLTSMAKEPGISAADRLLAVTSLSFDIAGLEIWLPLTMGAHVEIARRETAADGAALAHRLTAGRVTLLQATPTTFRLLLDAGWEGDGALTVLVGGEAVPRDLVDRLAPRVRAMWNMYGPTETTIWSCVQRLAAGAPVLIGRPIANTQAYVVDPATAELAPIGVPGELCIGGDGVAPGYLDRPELSAERFVADPFARRDGARMYRTGDLVRRRPDGALEFLGRLDLQVKVRGVRIELGEIEAVLAQAPAVREAVVAVHRDAHGEPKLVAYVTTQEGASIASAALRAHLAASLPDTMVPSAFVVLDRLPLTANNKIDRRALPAPEMLGEGEGDAPVGPVAEALGTIFAEVLGAPHVGARDGFFDLGGHSILAAAVIARIRDAFGVELPLRALFEAPTVAALAPRVEALLRSEIGDAPPPMVRAPRDGELLLSFGQERFWFLNQLDPTNQAYLMPLAMRLAGALDRDALARTLAELVRRHEVLRTVYVQVGARPVVVILDDHRPELRVVSAPSDDREAWLRRAIADALAEPFDFAAAPPFRAALFALGDDDHVLLLTLHHIVTDAWSTGILNRELSQLYDAFREGRPSPLPALRLQYVDYAQWQRAFLTGDVIDRQLAYWRGALDGAPLVLDLPTDRPRPAIRSGRGARRPVTIPKALASALRDLARREGVTMFMLLLAAFQALLHRYSGQEDILVGSPIATRSHAETEDLIGFFVNVLVLRARFEDATTVRALLARVKEACLGAYAHQDTPFERLVQELVPDRDLGRPPLVQVSFVLQTAPHAKLELSGVRQRGAMPENTTAQVELSLSLTERADGITGTLEYAVELFDAATVDRMIDHLVRMLAGMVEDASAAVVDLPLLSPDERARILAQSTTSDVAAPIVACAHDLFSAQAARTPDAPALLHEGRVVTYADLDARSNRLARYLQRFDIGPESIVGAALGRSPLAIVALLAVLKAGGAYLPLDPTLPEARLRFMMADADIAVLLTEDRVLDELPAVAVPAIAIDASAAIIDAEPDGPLPSLATPASAAYVIYTSGSTGEPKGVVVEHRGIGNLAAAQAHAFAIDASSRVLQFASPSFDASISEILVTLLAGATLVLASPEAMLPGPDLLRTLEANAVSVVTLPPSALAVLPVAPLSALRTLVVAGEACPEDVANRWAEGRRFIDAYGPTEATVCATMGEHQPLTGKPSIGRPMDHVRVYVLDPRGNPTPIGVPGEIHLGGIGVARGYLGRPELTSARFTPNPFAEGRLYRTGDRARWRADGRLDFLGRLDQQLKLRGHRIEPGEIEASLRAHPDVHAAAVVLRDDRGGDPRLVAYVVPREPPAPEAADLREHLAARLPPYMIPSAFVALASLPIGPTGKLERRALPAPEAVETTSFVAPRTDTERIIATIWEEVVGVPRVGVHDDFFELGGHSLLATQVMARIAEALGIELPLSALFEVKTVTALAAIADLARGAPISALDMEEGEL
ncbi:Malonyl CoA-acyl carrier protein transacylase [Minicystis rosea]|nr:Malonyl CoA-acyl carrier protein transacylase [Minicystis rosea]